MHSATKNRDIISYSIILKENIETITWKEVHITVVFVSWEHEPIFVF